MGGKLTLAASFLVASTSTGAMADIPKAVAEHVDTKTTEVTEERDFVKLGVKRVTRDKELELKSTIANGGIIQVAALSPDVRKSVDTTNDNATLAIEDNNSQEEITQFIRGVYQGIMGIAKRSKDQGSDVNIEGIDSDLRENLLPKMVKYSKKITQYIGDEDGSIKSRKKYLRRIKRQIKRFLNDYDLGFNEVSVDWILANVPGTIVLATADELSVKNIDYSITVKEMEAELEKYLLTGDDNGVSKELIGLVKLFKSIKELDFSIRESEASIRESEASIRESEASIRESEASSRESEASSRESEASIRESEASIRESEASIRESEASSSKSQKNIKVNDEIIKIIDRINKIRGVKPSNV